MRPTSLQHEICLQSLLSIAGESTTPGESDPGDERVDEQFVIDLVTSLSAAPAVRPGVVHGASLLLDPRLAPSAGDVADALLRRLVCDRVR